MQLIKGSCIINYFTDIISLVITYVLPSIWSYTHNKLCLSWHRILGNYAYSVITTPEKIILRIHYTLQLVIHVHICVYEHCK